MLLPVAAALAATVVERIAPARAGCPARMTGRGSSKGAQLPVEAAATISQQLRRAQNGARGGSAAAVGAHLVECEGVDFAAGNSTATHASAFPSDKRDRLQNKVTTPLLGRCL